MIAYLLLAHTNSKQLELLVQRLLSDVRSAIFLHFDARMPLPSWVIPMQRAGYLTVIPRIAVHWGGFSMVRAMRELLVAAMANSGCDRFVLVSGSCFPLRPQRIVNDAVLRHDGGFALWKLISGPGATPTRREVNAISKLHFMDIGWLNPSAGKLRRQLRKLLDRTNALLPYNVQHHGPVAKGSQWFCVTRHQAGRLISEGNRLAPEFARSFAPDETLFQTVWYRDRVAQGIPAPFIDHYAPVQGLHYIAARPPADLTLADRLWRTVDLRRMTIEDVEPALRSGALFARKCTPEVVKALLPIVLEDA